jgi:hypothetical protein
MNDKTFYTGLNLGWDWAGLYITGTKADRRIIRRKLARMRESFNPLVRGIWEGFQDRASQRAGSILKGIAPRTINPHRLLHTLERV